MNKAQSIFANAAKTVSNTQPIKVMVDNPIATGVAASYITGKTIALVAAGYSTKVALAYSFGTTLAGGAIIYGTYHLYKKYMLELVNGLEQ